MKILINSELKPEKCAALQLHQCNIEPVLCENNDTTRSSLSLSFLMLCISSQHYDNDKLNYNEINREIHLILQPKSSYPPHQMHMLCTHTPRLHWRCERGIAEEMHRSEKEMRKKTGICARAFLRFPVKMCLIASAKRTYARASE